MDDTTQAARMRESERSLRKIHPQLPTMSMLLKTWLLISAHDGSQALCMYQQLGWAVLQRSGFPQTLNTILPLSTSTFKRPNLPRPNKQSRRLDDQRRLFPHLRRDRLGCSGSATRLRHRPLSSPHPWLPPHLSARRRASRGKDVRAHREDVPTWRVVDHASTIRIQGPQGVAFNLIGVVDTPVVVEDTENDCLPKRVFRSCLKIPAVRKSILSMKQKKDHTPQWQRTGRPD